MIYRYSIVLLCCILLTGCLSAINKRETITPPLFMGQTLPAGKKFYFYAVEVNTKDTDASPEYVTAQFAKFFSPHCQETTSFGQHPDTASGLQAATSKQADYAVKLRINRWESLLYHGQFVDVELAIFDLTTGEQVSGTTFRSNCIFELFGKDRSTNICAYNVVSPWLDRAFTQ